MPDFEQFVAEHLDELARTAYLLVSDEREAEDLVQDCLFRVARRWRRVRRMEMPVAYTRRILINLAADGARTRARRRVELEPSIVMPEPFIDPLAAHDDRAELLGALAVLPVRQRAVLILRYFNDLTETQVAEILGCSPGTVKSSAARGLARLREVLEPATLGSKEH
jgi:RNA polymerase sigma-70 factor (sigma-E family)